MHFSSRTDDWATPQWLFDGLDAEFGFELDVCASPQNAKCARYFCLLPARTDTRWRRRYVMRAGEVRLLRGRLKFGDAKHAAPFPSAIVVFRPPTPAVTAIATGGARPRAASRRDGAGRRGL